jgi:hypothetical protein
VALGKTLTVNKFRKRYFVVVDRCCMCKRNEESMVHPFFHCEVACALWNASFSRFGLSWVMPRKVANLYASWWTSGSSGRWCLLASCGVFSFHDFFLFFFLLLAMCFSCTSCIPWLRLSLLMIFRLFIKKKMNHIFDSFVLVK